MSFLQKQPEQRSIRAQPAFYAREYVPKVAPAFASRGKVLVVGKFSCLHMNLMTESYFLVTLLTSQIGIVKTMTGKRILEEFPGNWKLIELQEMSYKIRVLGNQEK